MRAVQNAVGPQGKEHLFLAGGEKIMLELTLDGEAECYQVFQVEQRACTKAHDNEKLIMARELYLVYIAGAEGARQVLGVKLKGWHGWNMLKTLNARLRSIDLSGSRWKVTEEIYI